MLQENKAHQIFRKTNISYPLIRTRTCAYQEVRNVHFSENLAGFVLLQRSCWDSPFCFITNELTHVSPLTLTVKIVVNILSLFLAAPKKPSQLIWKSTDWFLYYGNIDR